MSTARTPVAKNTAWRSRIIGEGTEAPDQLLAHPNNYRIHPKAQQDALAGALNEIGWIQRVIVNQRTGHVIDGHARIEIAISRDEPSVPVLYVDLDENEEKIALASLDPLAAMAVQDPEKWADLLAEITVTDEALRAMLTADEPTAGLTDPDAVPEVAEPVTQPGDLWLLGDHRLLCGDSTKAEDVGRLMAGERVPLMLTDPPYGISVVSVTGKMGSEGGPSPFGGKKRARLGAADGSKPVTINGNGRGTVGSGHLVAATLYMPVAGDDRPFDPAPYINLADNLIMFGGNYFASRLADSRCWIVWDKNNTGNFADAELAWTSFDKGVRLYKNTWNGLVREGLRDVEGLHRVHPTQKPVGLFEAILGDFSAPHAIVLDPFLGSGTTLIACERLGRRCYAMEIESRYVQVALQRWADFTGRDPVREDGATLAELKQHTGKKAKRERAKARTDATPRRARKKRGVHAHAS